MLPEGVKIDPATGALTPSTGEYVKHLSALRGIYQNDAALDGLIATHGDVLAYKVVEFREEGSDIFFGTTTMQPGRVGDEFFMTRGHYHANPTMGEIYYTQSGEGLLLLQSRDGKTREVAMKPGVCAFIPPDWAHRSVNTGEAPLVFVWCCNQQAGHDYAEILTKGMRKLAVFKDGVAVCEDNPRFAG